MRGAGAALLLASFIGAAAGAFSAFLLDVAYAALMGVGLGIVVGLVAFMVLLGVAAPNRAEAADSARRR